MTPPVPSPGIFIAFEGIDGVGKTTQANLLKSALERAGEKVVLSKEPTNGKFGIILRESALNGRLPADEELEAFVNDRKEHLESLVRPALEAGKVVILDRYFYSTIAYQGARTNRVDNINDRMREFAEIPDRVFLLDADPAVCLARIGQRDGKANEFEKLDQLIAIREIFNHLANRDEEIQVLDGESSVEAIHGTIIYLLLNDALKKRCFKSYGCEEPIYCGYRMRNMCQWAKLYGALKSDLPDTQSPALRASCA
jgi:dTMP kinase